MFDNLLKDRGNIVKNKQIRKIPMNALGFPLIMEMDVRNSLCPGIRRIPLQNSD